MSSTFEKQDITHALALAGVFGWDQPPPPIKAEGAVSSVLRPLPFSGSSVAQSIAIPAGQSLRVQPALYNYDGAVQYKLGTTGTRIDVTDIHRAGTMTVVPWVDKTPQEAGFPAIVSGDSLSYGPFAQFAGGYVMVTVTALDNAYGEGVAIGMDEKIGVGTKAGVAEAWTNTTNVSWAFGGPLELAADQFPFWDIDMTQTPDYFGALNKLKASEPIVGSNGASSSRTFVIPVRPSSYKYMHMATAGECAITMSSLSTRGVSSATDVTTWGSADMNVASLGGTAYNQSHLRIRERLAYANAYTNLLAGMPQIDITCSSGSNGLVARIQAVMHYHIHAPRTHVNIDWHKLNVPIPLTNAHIGHQAVAVGAVGKTVQEAVHKARTGALEVATDPAAKVVLSHPSIPRVTEPRVPTTVSQTPVSHKGFLAGLWSSTVGAVEATVGTVVDVAGSVGSGALAAVRKVGRWAGQKLETEGASMAERQIDQYATGALARYGYGQGADGPITRGPSSRGRPQKRSRVSYDDLGTGFRGSTMEGNYIPEGYYPQPDITP